MGALDFEPSLGLLVGYVGNLVRTYIVQEVQRLPNNLAYNYFTSLKQWEK